MKPLPVDLDEHYLQSVDADERQRKRQAIARRAARAPAYRVVITLDGVYTTDDLERTFDLRPYEVRWFAAWLSDRPGAVTVVEPGVWAFDGVTVEITEPESGSSSTDRGE